MRLLDRRSRAPLPARRRPAEGPGDRSRSRQRRRAPPPTATTHVYRGAPVRRSSATRTSAFGAFAMGLRRDVAWALQQVPGIRVASRTSTDTVRGQAIRQHRSDSSASTRCSKAASSVPPDTSESSPASSSRATEERLRMPVRIDLPSADVLSAQDEAARHIVVRREIGSVRTSHPVASNPDAYVEYQRGLHAQRELLCRQLECRDRARDPRHRHRSRLRARLRDARRHLQLARPALADEAACGLSEGAPRSRTGAGHRRGPGHGPCRARPGPLRRRLGLERGRNTFPAGAGHRPRPRQCTGALQLAADAARTRGCRARGGHPRRVDVARALRHRRRRAHLLPRRAATTKRSRSATSASTQAPTTCSRSTSAGSAIT